MTFTQNNGFAEGLWFHVEVTKEDVKDEDAGCLPSDRHLFVCKGVPLFKGRWACGVKQLLA